MKLKRRAVLLELIEAGLVSSQTEAVGLLEAKGFGATQATVSRDLEELGAVRIKDGDSVRYGVLEAGSEFGMSLQQVTGNFVLSHSISKNIIVLKTPPGHAGMVAAAIDRASIKEVLGCIAGDDTVFICVAEKVKGAQVVEGLGLVK